MSYEDFVDSLFSFAKKPKKYDLYIQRNDGHITKIEILHVDGKVFILMDDVEMGHFEEFDQREYKCRFFQKYRAGIRNGLLPNEALMKSICDNQYVLFVKA